MLLLFNRKIVGGTKVTQSIIDKIASLTKLEKL